MEHSSIQMRNSTSGVGASTSGRSKYASQACQECRRRRAKCNNKKPCERCSNRGSQCVYLERSDKRGTAPKSLVALLQTRIKLLEKVLWLHSIDIDASVAGLKARDTVVPDSTSAAATLPSSFGETENVPKGALHLDESWNFDDNGEARYFGVTSGRIELLRSSSSVGVTGETSPLLGDIRARPPFNLGNQAIDPATEISRELMDHLVDLYFEWEQPWCQIVDETLFRQSWHTMGRFCSPLLLNSIFAIASRYSDRPEMRSLSSKSSASGQLFLEVADVLLHFDMKTPTLTTIQSLAIMAMVNVSMGFDAKGWLLHGMAIRIALDMGLNLDSTILNRLNQFSLEEVKLRDQIYWALYCTDKLWASYTGRVCTMMDFQAVVRLPSLTTSTHTSVASENPSSQRSAISALLHRGLCTQCQILEKIMVNLYAPQRLPPGAQRQAFLDSCLLELKSWKYNLPIELDTSNTRKEGAIPHAYLLEMVYHTSIILLIKPFLPKSSTEALPSTIEFTKKALALCVEAAREICSLSERFRESFGSFRQSPVTATHCTLSAALVILHAHKNNGKNRNANIKRLESCLETLRELSEAWVPARRFWHGLLHVVRDRPGSRPDNLTEVSSSTPDSAPGPNGVKRMSSHADLKIPSCSTLPKYDIHRNGSHAVSEDYEDLNYDCWSPLESFFAPDELMMFDIPFWSELSQDSESVP